MLCLAAGVARHFGHSLDTSGRRWYCRAVSSQAFADRLEDFARRAQASPKNVRRASPKMPTHKVVHLLELKEIRAAWHVSSQRVYQLAEQDRVQVFARPGRRKYYSGTDIIREFGLPTSDRAILEDAVAHLLATLERENPTTELIELPGPRRGSTPRYLRENEAEPLAA